MIPQVLLLESNKLVAQLTAKYLRSVGFAVLPVHSPREAERVIAADAPDVVVLDSGLDADHSARLLDVLKQRGGEAALIIATRMPDHRLLALLRQYPAADYLPKPFALSVLAAKIEAWARTVRTGHPPLLVVDAGTRTVSSGKASMTLSNLEYHLLMELATHPQRPVLDLPGGGVDGRSKKAKLRRVAVYVSYLRRKLLGIGVADCIVTDRGRGYRWCGPRVVQLRAPSGSNGRIFAAPGPARDGLDAP